MNVSLPECPYLQPDLKFAARMKQLSQTLAIPEDAGTVSSGNPEIFGNPGADPGNRLDHADGGVVSSEQ